MCPGVVNNKSGVCLIAEWLRGIIFACRWEACLCGGCGAEMRCELFGQCGGIFRLLGKGHPDGARSGGG